MIGSFVSSAVTFLMSLMPMPVSNSSARVFADDQIANRFFGLMGFVDGEYFGCRFVNFEPRIANGNALQRLVFRTRKRHGTTPESADLRERPACRIARRSNASNDAAYYACTTSGTRVAGGVLRLRWMLTAPSVITMPTPARSPF